MKNLIIFILMGALAPINIFAQSMNRISVQTGLFHYFFDKTPVLNTNHPQKHIKPFHGTFYNSIDLQYRRKINYMNAISIEGSYYSESYQNVIPNKLKGVYYMRSFGAINSTYERTLNLSQTINLTYGGGLNFRIGTEDFIVNFSDLGVHQGAELNLETRIIKDLGLNIRSGIEYTPLTWLTLYTKVDLIGFLYLNDKKQIDRMRNQYNYKNYPTPFDLSWQFGIGFNFGK